MPVVADLLSGYQPRDEAEATDVARIRELVSTAEDPWHRSTPLHVTASAVVVHPESGRVLLRWLTLPEAHELAERPNIRETLTRVGLRLRGFDPHTPTEGNPPDPL